MTECVALALPQALDVRMSVWMRTRHEWSDEQVAWTTMVDALGPPVVACWVSAVAGVVCLVRRTVRPALVAAGALAAAAAMTLVVKEALDRPDPQGMVTGHGGSFPSGHTVGVILGVGLAVHLLAPQGRRWLWCAAALAGAAMGSGLVLIGAHWISDVAGGFALGFAVLAAVRAVDGARPGGRRGRPAGGGWTGRVTGPPTARRARSDGYETVTETSLQAEDGS